MNERKDLWIKDSFAREARDLRAVFDKRFRDPRVSRSDRFVWDYWHVPDQHTLVRTPADSFFPRSLYSAFLKRLCGWGRSELGCSAVSPPWLSYYVEGC